MDLPAAAAPADAKKTKPGEGKPNGNQEPETEPAGKGPWRLPVLVAADLSDHSRLASADAVMETILPAISATRHKSALNGDGEPEAQERKTLTCGVGGRSGGGGGEGVEQERGGQKRRQKTRRPSPHCLFALPPAPTGKNQEKEEFLEGRVLGEKKGGDHGHLRTRKEGSESNKESGLFCGACSSRSRPNCPQDKIGDGGGVATGQWPLPA
jgi:hypothetical protein